MEGKVSWLAEVEPLLHIGQDDERIIFCRSPLIWEEAVAFHHLFLDRSRDLAPLVFEVCMVNVDALLEGATFFFSTFDGVPLSASPAFWGRSLKELQRMLFQPYADRDAEF